MREITEKLTIVRWIDGDTFSGLYKAIFTVPWHEGTPITITMPVIVRCWGYDAPEINNPKTHDAGLEAKYFVEKIATPGTEVIFESKSKGEDKYGRWLARTVIPGMDALDNLMVQAGHGKR